MEKKPTKRRDKDRIKGRDPRVVKPTPEPKQPELIEQADGAEAPAKDEEMAPYDFSRHNRAGSAGISSFQEFKDYVDGLMAKYKWGPEILKLNWDVPASERAKVQLFGSEAQRFNSMFDWLHLNDPFSLGGTLESQQYLESIRLIAYNSMYMMSMIDFNGYASGLWAQKYNAGQVKKTEREKERAASGPHPMVAFILEQPTKTATLKQLKDAFSEQKYIHSYLHYLQKKELIVKDGEVYKTVEKK